MNSQEWQTVNELFDKALDENLDESSESGWNQFIDRQQIVNRTIAEKTRGLLRKHASAQHFLATPAAHLPQEILDAIQIPVTELEAGSKLHDFTIERLLGKGAFGAVYLAKQNSLNRMVALKITNNVSTEARLMADLEHDFIVPVYSETVDIKNHRRLICMQYVSGTTLQTLISSLRQRRGGLITGKTIIEILDDQASLSNAGFDPSSLRSRATLQDSSYSSACMWIVARLAEALDFAHARGVVHLDVKPANILIDPYGRPKLTDFNISRARELDHNQCFGGTLAYMSPEHSVAFNNNTPESVTAQCDIYSLAIVLAEMLTLESTDSLSLPLDDKSHQFSRNVSGVLEKALSPVPAERFQTGAEFAASLENARELDLVTDRLPASSFASRWILRAPLFVLLFLGFLPNIAGDVVNILYNRLQIVLQLTAQQQSAFYSLLLPYHIVAYSTATAIVLWRFRPMIKIFPAIKSGRAIKHKYITNLRQDILRMPYIFITATSIGWLPGSLIFPAVICLYGPLPLAVCVHFAISFTMSWLIALTFSFLLIDYFIIIGIYPRLWSIDYPVGNQANDELRGVRRRHCLLQALAGLVPLVGAAMLVFLILKDLSEQSMQVFKALVIGMIGIGMFGFIFALVTTERVKSVMDAFTQPRV